MANRFNIYTPNHQHALAVCSALATGSGLPMVPPAPLLSGGVAMYGFLRGLLPTLQQAHAEARPWVYMDRGYFRSSYGADYTGFFRVTRSAYQHHGRGVSALARWQRLVLRIAPWRKGRHVLVCPPGEVFTRAIGGFAAEAWLSQTLGELQCSTDRPIRVRRKPAPGKGTPLAIDLQDCHALVTYMSNTAVEAVLAGTPVFCTGQCAASVMGSAQLKEVETPYYPDNREQWAGVLADNQWTLQELRAGAANYLFHETVK